MVPPAGFEPAPPPPEGGALSPELRGRTVASLAHGPPRTDARVMAHAEIHRDRRIDAADFTALSGRTLAVIGFGNQGAAQAANLRDSGFAPLVGNRDDEYATSA